MTRQPPLGLGLLDVQVSRPPSDTSHLVGLLRTSERPCQHTSQEASMPLARFEPEIPVSERPQTNATERAATGVG
jgi:hypothetical protein